MNSHDSEEATSSIKTSQSSDTTNQPSSDPLEPERETTTTTLTVDLPQPISPKTSNETSPAVENSASQKLREVQDTVLHFFANASNETLGACAVGLCASTYLVLGRVGLVLIGAVGGIVLHATWEQNQHSTGENKGNSENAKRRREQGLDIAKRALDWRERNRTNQNEDLLSKVETSISTKELDFSDFQPHTKQALTEFTDAVIRDYVKWWYSPILPTETSFPSSCRQVLTGFLLSFSNHLSRKRTEDPFLDFIANGTSMIIVFLNELGAAMKASPNQNVEAAIKTYLHYEPESSLANVVNPTQHERKLRLVADDILQSFVDSKVYNCMPAQTFLREVLASLILQPTINSCSKPEWINGWIVYLLEDGEPELMNVIDAGVENLSDTVANSKVRGSGSTEDRKHQRRVSKAEEAMQEAMKEAQRMNEMIAEDEARRKRGESILEADSTLSASTTDAGIPTPGSSVSDLNQNLSDVQEDSFIFDAEGNAMPSGTSSPARVISPSRPKQQRQFTSFDQLSPVSGPTASQTEFAPPAMAETMSAAPLTLQNASITILDMGSGSDRIPLKQLPTDEFLVQIEPAASRFPGWMVTRKYADFEPLHESLRRIANISGAQEFNVQQPSLPNWKGQTRSVLIGHLEQYLKRALSYGNLAESTAMKKFLDKDIGLDKMPGGNKNVLSQGAAALDNVGKGFINALGQGGKGIAGGGKAVLGGMQGVFGAVGSAVGGPKKNSSPARQSTNDLSNTMNASTSTLNSGRPSLDFVGGTDLSDDPPPPPLPTRPSQFSNEPLGSPNRVINRQSEEILNLPPPPSEITEDFVPQPRKSGTFHKSTPSTSAKSSRPTTPIPASSVIAAEVAAPMSKPQPETLRTTDIQLISAAATPLPATASTLSSNFTPTTMTTSATTPVTPSAKKSQPLTEEETRITVDLLFAIITSTYSLSSAWFRLSLLSAAKAILLRPNNPQLESIRALIQESLINNQTSDDAIAGHIRKLRENSLPTEEELAKWPKEMTGIEKEKLRVKARKLLVEKGMPQTLTSVMGQAASGEALGKVFDCLQVQEVARGLMFAVLLQALRAVMQ